MSRVVPAIGRGDRRLAPRDPVQEARFAGVGRPDDRDADAVAQPLPAVAVGEMALDLGGELAGFGEDAVFDFRRQIFVGKIDRGFEMGESMGQPARPIAIEIAEFAVELAQCLTALRIGLGHREVGDRLGLGEVELAVQKGAAGELAGLGEPQPEPAQRPHYRGEHGAAAVQMELGDILAGGARRGREPQDESVVERLPGRRVDDPASSGGSRRRQVARQG